MIPPARRPLRYGFAVLALALLGSSVGARAPAGAAALDGTQIAPGDGLKAMGIPGQTDSGVGDASPGGRLLLRGTALTGTPAPYPFFPQAGNLWQDLQVTNFVDVGDGATPRDYDCSAWSYVGHLGHDSVIAGFREQQIGVPVFAALDGTVAAVHDGEPDTNTTVDPRPANYVIVDHANGQQTRYWHLKGNSILVHAGQAIAAGTQLALTGSSGSSTWPHLHFESRMNGVVFEPSAGPCRAGASYWVHQTSIPRTPFVTSLTFSNSPFTGTAALPWDQVERTGTFLIGLKTTSFRLQISSVPPSSVFHMRYLRPNATTSLEYTHVLGNSETYRAPWFWFEFTQTFDTVGTWTLEFSLNGSVIATAPFLVAANGPVNRPPNAISVALDPAAPTEDDVAFCRVQTPLYLRDPDYDLVRYTYRWTVNGTVVRQVVSAALSDALPRGTIRGGDVASCAVTPSDGVLEGPRAEAETLDPLGPAMSLDRTALRFAASSTGSTFTTQTAPQIVRLTQAGTGTVTWTAISNQPWLTVTPSAGTGSAALSVAVQSAAGLPISGEVAGTITWSMHGASTTAGPIAVNLAIVPAGTSQAPFGFVETPADGTTGVTGSIAVTGWALDDIDVQAVKIYRDAVGPTPYNLVYIGDASFVEGARPDVAGGYPGYPRNTRAGWGYLMLTNFLPDRGNGTFRLHAYAFDREGHSTLLGSRTIACTNDQATTPFGAIDTPGQGETVSGTVNNFGWVLAPGTRRADPPGGGSVTVFIDGQPVGTPTGWTSRSDLSALFPVAQFSGVDTALAVYSFDSTALGNRVHTIAWSVTDNQVPAATSGVGSRYFTVSNGAAAAIDANPIDVVSGFSRTNGVSGSADAASAFRRTGANGDGVRLKPDTTSAAPLRARRGFDLDAPYRTYRAAADGVITIQSQELDRIELLLEPGSSGWLQTSDGPQPLPIGSHLHPTTGVFTWQPGVGFVGAYDFVFTTPDLKVRPTSARTVRMVLNPKGSGRVGPQVVIDIPAVRLERDAVTSADSLIVAGWAADLDAFDGTGIDAIHLWAFPLTGPAEAGHHDTPIFLGAATLAGRRPDVAAIYGAQFRDSGYSLTVDHLAPGEYLIAVFAHRSSTNAFLPATVVPVIVR